MWMGCIIKKWNTNRFVKCHQSDYFKIYNIKKTKAYLTICMCYKVLSPDNDLLKQIGYLWYQMDINLYKLNNQILYICFWKITLLYKTFILE